MCLDGDDRRSLSASDLVFFVVKWIVIVVVVVVVVVAVVVVIVRPAWPAPAGNDPAGSGVV